MNSTPSSRYHVTTLHDGQTLAYLDESNGPPTLLMHGFTGTAVSHMGSVLEMLRTRHRVVAPDLRGYGRSRPLLRDFPADFYRRDADDMAELLDHLGCGPVIVFGFSDGAESALLLAALRPDLVRAGIVWGVSGVISQAMLDSVQDWLPVESWGPEREEWREEISAFQGADQVEPMIGGWVEAARAIFASGGNICREEANRIHCPILLINGAGEVGNTVADVQILAGRIPQARLEIVPACGHAAHEDQPDLFRGLCEGFLSDVVPGT